MGRAGLKGIQEARTIDPCCIMMLYSPSAPSSVLGIGGRGGGGLARLPQSSWGIPGSFPPPPHTLDKVNSAVKGAGLSGGPGRGERPLIGCPACPGSDSSARSALRPVLPCLAAVGTASLAGGAGSSLLSPLSVSRSLAPGSFLFHPSGHPLACRTLLSPRGSLAHPG